MYLESYTREARFLMRWDQRIVAQRRGGEPAATGEASTTRCRKILFFVLFQVC